MAEEELSEAINFIAEVFAVHISEQFDPFQPNLLIEAFSKMFPASGELWKQVLSDNDVEGQWDAVLEFIQISLLNGSKLEFEVFGAQQIAQIYLLVAQYVEQWMEHQQFSGESLPKQQQKKGTSGKKEKKEVSHGRSQDKKKGSSKQAVKQIVKKKSKNEEKSKSNKKEKISVEKQREPKQQKIEIKKAKAKKEIQSRERSANMSRNKKERPKKEEKKLEEVLVEQVKGVIQKRARRVQPKTNTLFRDPKGLQAVKKANRQFQYFLKDYQREGKLKRKFDPYLKDANKKLVDEHFLKVVEKKQKDIQQEVTNQQLKYFITLRDRKIAFINKIHKLTEQLQRERQVAWAHQQREVMDQQRERVRLQIEKTEGLFDKNMEMLKQQYQDRRKQKQNQVCDQLQICRQMQKAVSKKKMQQMQLMRVLWQQQNAKLSNIIGDEQKVKGKLIDLYRKNRP